MVILPEYFHLRGIGRFLSRDILLGQTGVKKGGCWRAAPFEQQGLFFLQNDTGVNDFHSLAFFVNQDGICIRLFNFIAQVEDHV